ncbi:MAG: AraC family transcriptional regulator [Clostridia bacterium]|nr:AraC family transcriptional regulator [Clostridia bacterium]
MKLFSHYIEQQRKRYPEIINWENHLVGDRLAYSYRDTVYDRNTYPSNLHYHDYYELVIFEEGNIQYICGGNVYHLNYGDIILIPPGEFHMSVIACEQTHYKRHVFYLYPSAFDAVGHGVLTSFLTQIKSGELLTIGSLESRRELMELLQQLNKTFSGDITPLDEALGLSYLIRIFCLLNQDDCRVKNDAVALPENILELQHYIDQNFAQISSVAQVAEHFFYSREYVSRLFRKYFDTTISDYITKRRIAESQLLIVQNLPMTDIAYRVGFGSLSTFIRAFRTVTGMTPSEYRKLRKEIQL